jgi:predicted transcriptional regulator
MDKTLTIRLEAELARSLEQEARRSNRSKGSVVREALKEHLSKDRPSALDALRKYAGIMHGPADLSTNRKYLSGMGRRKRS